MTNKDSIQKKHLEAISDVTADTGNWGEYGGINVESKKEAATSCTTVTADAIGEYHRWVNSLRTDDNVIYVVDNSFVHESKLPELFLNQKAK